MVERPTGVHPNAAELQAHADGEAVDERVAAHVASCAECRGEVAAIRRVTAALSLGSKPPDSLMEKILARRAQAAQGAAAALPRAPQRRRRIFLLPAGLAAAATLALLVPRVWRAPPADGDRPAAGAKGASPADIVVNEIIVTETGATSIDSLSWDISGAGISAELRYVAGVAGSSRAALLAERVVHRLVEGGLDRSSITILPVAARDDTSALPAGAVRVTLRGRVP